MGRRKFRLSDMIPNAWFYKLRDMRARGRDRGGVTRQPSFSSSRGNGGVQRPATPRNASAAHAFPHRASYYYTSRGKELPPPSVPRPRATDERSLPPLQSPLTNSRRRHKVRPFKPGQELVSAPRGQKPVAEAPGGSSQRRRDMYIVCDGGELRVPTVTFPADEGLTGKVIASEKDIVIDLLAADTPAERVLRPILTRPVRRQADPYELEDSHVELADMAAKDSPAASEKSSRPRRSASSGRRLKTRANSPRLAAVKGRPASSPARRSSRLAPAPAIADSFAVVKTSEDPRKDFLESMEEMIAEKDIRRASDLEDLLACYLSLNAAEHHDLIVEVFEEIWTGAAKVKLSD